MERRKPRSYNRPDYEGTITASYLRRSGRDTQLDVMREWFNANYVDPAENTPYETAEGGYIYIWGGPYEPLEELGGEFGGLIPDKVIQELADELREICEEWTGNYPKEDDEDDYLFAYIAQSSEHRKSFEESITNIEHLISLETTGQQQQHLRRLLYVNVITALETYLSDLFISAVAKDQALLRRFVETTPEFKSEKIAVSDIFKTAEEIEKKARAYLMDVVWHHLRRVKPMFKDKLGLSFPDNMGDLFKAVLIRHDLVHRNGKKRDGGEHNVSKKEIKDIIGQARSFVADLDSQWAK